MSCNNGFQGKCGECPDKLGCSKVSYHPIIQTVKMQGDKNMITAVAVKNMRWFYRKAEGTVHIQMVNTDKPALNNRSYGMSFSIGLDHILYHALLSKDDLIAKLSIEARGDTQSLSTDKLYTKGAIIDYASSCVSGVYDLSMLVYLGRSYQSTRFWIDDKYDDLYVEPAKFVLCTGYIVDEDLAAKISAAYALDESSKPSADN